MNDARTALTTSFATVDQISIDNLNGMATAATAKLFENECALLKQKLDANTKQIGIYNQQLQGLQPTGSPSDLQDTFAIAAGIPPAPPDITPTTSTEADYWTSISLEVSSSYSAEQSSSSSNTFSVGGSASWGLWSVGGSAAHSDATADLAKQMANSSIKASFECMRVDITRSWLRAELFYDDDLSIAKNNK